MSPTKIKPESEMDPTGLADLPASLGMAVFESLPANRFRTAGSLPSWLQAGTLGPQTGEGIDLCDRFPMLEVFLPECDPVWQGASDIWTEPDNAGGELYIQAFARQTGGRRFLVLKTLPKEIYTYQQLAHDFELEKNKVERLGLELESKRQEAERATRAKSEFLARMSHEIRTPLNAVIGMTDVLSATSLTAEQRRCVEVSQRNGLGLLGLINDILDLSKVEADKIELEAVEMDLRDVVSRAMEAVEARATAKGLWLRRTIAPATPVRVVGDPNRLRQVLINLLGNSIKFTELGGLEVGIGPDPNHAAPGRLQFAVTDTGVGIAPDKLDSIFESFTQADTSTTRKYGGTGLGLTISKQLVELMGGRVWVESTVGAGSTFYFTAAFDVPETQPHSEENPATPQIPLEELEKRATGMRILLADDNADNRFLILSYLKRTNSSIDIAENGARAVELFRENRYDVILMDVEMPVMDGCMATSAIRAIEKAAGCAPTPVLALTAHAFADMAERGAAAGFTELLTKPIRSATLLMAIGKYAGPVNRQGPPRVRVAIEEGMEDVAPGYLAKRQADVAVYRQALAEQDMQAIRMMAHRMKGTGTGYGFPLLTELGSALEQAANKADSAEIQRKLDEFAAYVNSVELV